jgi:hypothetical protein
MYFIEQKLINRSSNWDLALAKLHYRLVLSVFGKMVHVDQAVKRTKVLLLLWNLEREDNITHWTQGKSRLQPMENGLSIKNDMTNIIYLFCTQCPVLIVDVFYLLTGCKNLQQIQGKKYYCLELRSVQLALAPPCISCGRKLQVIWVQHQDETARPGLTMTESTQKMWGNIIKETNQTSMWHTNHTIRHTSIYLRFDVI